MLTLHHLRIGRSLFMVWLLEELGLDYQLKVYLRDPMTMRAPVELRDIHPLGKSPVIEDDGLILAESGAITTYLIETYGADRGWIPATGDKATRARFLHWLHYPEGSAFLPLFMRMMVMRSGQTAEPFDAFSRGETNLHLSYMSTELGDKPFILGDSISAADFGFAYIVSLGRRLGILGPFPNLTAYGERFSNRPAFLRAVERAVE